MRWAKWYVVLVVAVGAGCLFGPPGTGWPLPPAAAADSEAAKLQKLAEWGGRLQRLKAIDDLIKLDDNDAHLALEALADSKDEQLAGFAMSGLARAEYGGGKTKLQAILANANRSVTARSFALTSWCNLRAKEGADWNDVKGYVDTAAGTNETLKDTAACVKKAKFDEEGN